MKMNQNQLFQTLHKIPKNWNEVTVEQFQELHQVEQSESYLIFEKDIDKISIISDIDIDELEELTTKDIFKFKPFLQFLFKEPSKRFKTDFEFSGLHLKYVGLNSLTLAEFIDLDSFYVSNIIDNLHMVAAILYRQQKSNEWNQTISEAYNFDPFERGQLFKEVSIVDIYGIAHEFTKFHQDFLEKYKGLFSDDLDEDEEAPEDETQEEKKERLERIKDAKLQNRWGWDRMIFELSGRDITKIDGVLESNLILTFNQLSMKKELGL
jgi:hypothetical protein